MIWVNKGMHNQPQTIDDTFNDDPELIESTQVDPAALPERKVFNKRTIGNDMDVQALLVPKGKKLSLKSSVRERVVVLSQGSVAVQVDGAPESGFIAKAPAHFILPKGKLIDIVTFDEVICYGVGQHSQTIIPFNEEASKIEHFFTEGVYARKMEIQAGTQVPTHKHVYDHLSILAKGRVRVAVGPVIQEYVAPAMIEIKKDMSHKITALEDSVWFCIHATTATDIESLEQTVIVKE